MQIPLVDIVISLLGCGSLRALPDPVGVATGSALQDASYLDKARLHAPLPPGSAWPTQHERVE